MKPDNTDERYIPLGKFASGAEVAAVEADITEHIENHPSGMEHPDSDHETLVVTTDPRLSDAREPAPHAEEHEYPGGTDPITPASIGAVAQASLSDKGSLITATASGTPADLPAGSDFTTLISDASATKGLRWVSLTVRELCASSTSQSSNTTYSNPFAGIPVLSGVKYRVQVVILYTSAAATTGIRPSFSGPSIPEFFAVGTNQTGSGVEMAASAALGTDLQFTGAEASGACLLINASLQPNASGTLQFRFRSEVNGSAITVQAGSFWIVERLG